MSWFRCSGQVGRAASLLGKVGEHVLQTQLAGEALGLEAPCLCAVMGSA